MTYSKIIEAIDAHLAKSSKQYYNDFYIGIATDARDRLFSNHGVEEKNDWWIYRTADNDQIARDVERYYLDQGMQGGQGGGDENTKMVYCYEVSEHTHEDR